MTDFDKVKAGTQAAYDRKASEWDSGRSPQLGEAVWIPRLLDGLPSSAKVLDLGCGTGKPIADRILAAGFQLTGLDNSPAMIAIAQSNYPNATWHVGDIVDVSHDNSFDAVFSWDGFFHLTPAEQRQALPQIVRAIRNNGRLLLTIGEVEGHVTGNVYGETVYHSSLSHSEYTEILISAGMSEVSITMYEHSKADRIILFATKGNA